jgi:hypothetical protein
MNHFTTTLSLALLVAAVTPAMAATDNSPAVQQVEITTPRAAVLAAQAVLAGHDIDSVYEMSSGRRMAVTAWGDTLQVRYGRRGPVNVKHDGNGNFVSRDGRFNLQFGIDERGQPEVVTLTLPASWL